MGVFKEEAHTFENVARFEKLIWNDACDRGYPYEKDNPPQDIKDLIESVNHFKGLDASYPHEKPFIRKRQVWTGGVSLTIRIGWEIDEGVECGTQYTISFARIANPKHPNLLHKGCTAFISVEVEPYREPYVQQVNREN